MSCLNLKGLGHWVERLGMSDGAAPARSFAWRAGGPSLASIAEPRPRSRAQPIQPSISPSQVTPASLAPPRPLSAGALNLGSSAGPSAPEGAERFLVTIAADRPRRRISRNRVGDPGLCRNLLAGRRVSVAEIYEIAGRLEHLYADRGYRPGAGRRSPATAGRRRRLEAHRRRRLYRAGLARARRRNRRARRWRREREL